MNLDDLYDALRKRKHALDRLDVLKGTLKTADANVERIRGEILGAETDIQKHEAIAKKIAEVK